MGTILQYVQTMYEEAHSHQFADNPIIHKWGSIGLLIGLEGPEKTEMAYIFDNAAQMVIRLLGGEPHPEEEDFVSAFFPILRRLYSTKGCTDYARIWDEFHAFVHRHAGTIQEMVLGGADAQLWAVEAFCEEYEEFGLFSSKIKIMKL